MAKTKHKNHDKILKEFETEKFKSLQKAVNKTLKTQENSEKLKKYKINKNLLDDF